MSTKIQRIFILIIVAIFTISTIGIGIFYIFDAQNQKKQSDIQAGLIEAQKQLNAQKEQPAIPTEQTKENKLKGTQLQNFTPGTPIDKLSYTDTVVGTGTVVKAGDTVTVNYTGALASNGVIFESSLDSGSPATFGLDQVIRGWTDGLPGMKEGGTRRLFIPSALAYGANGQGGIPANSNLVFDVTLIKVGK